MSNVLVTGGTGFVGSHLVEKAREKGHRVFALVRKSSDTSILKALGIECLYAELTDSAALEKVFQNLQSNQIQIDTVIHCAGLTKAKSLEDFVEVNTVATQTLLNFVKQYQPNIRQIIFISSLAACGPKEIQGTIAINDAQPITNYGISKLKAEDVVKTSGLPYVIFRPTAVYGPREKDIFTIFQIVHKGLHPLIGSHQQQLTFIYVKDLVNLLLNSMDKPANNQTFFATDGNIYSKTDLGRYIEKELAKKATEFTIPLWLVKGLAFVSQSVFAFQKKSSPLNLEKYRELKAESWVCPVEDTFQTYNFSPEYDLKRGVGETTKWYLDEGWL
jgi:nucleoside-diphosphate-sugar epimerase